MSTEVTPRTLQSVWELGMDRTKPCKCGGVFRVVTWTKETKKSVELRKKFECDKCRKVSSLH